MVDWDAALQVAAGSHDLLKELVVVASEEVPSLMQALDEALAAKNAADAQRLAHTIKGTGRVFEDEALVTAATAVEQAASGGQLDQAHLAQTELAATAGRFLRELREFMARECGGGESS